MTGLTILKIELTREAAFDIMETSLNAGHTSGIGYWALDEAADEGELQMSDDGLIVPRNNEPFCREVLVRKDGRALLTPTVIQTAILRMLSEPEKVEAVGSVYRFFEGGDMDGPLADVIIQVACFGKVVYA